MDKSTNARKIIVLILSFLLVMTSMPFSGFLPKKAKAATYVPKDTFTIEKISDGTHNGPGTETFINSKNGFKVADDTKDDGVVASGDYVTYKFNLSVEAGPKRTLKVSFKQSGDSLEIKDFGNAAISDPIITGKWDGDSWNYTVARGAAGNIEGVFSIRAKDTKGLTAGENFITATLTNGSYKYVSKTKPVVVTSTPFADLTLQNMNEWVTWTENYHQTREKASFKIVPVSLSLDGYSNAGLVSSAKWHTDLNVSSLPEGTTFKVNGESVPVQDGKLKDLTGTGEAIVTYQIPDDKKPSDKNPDAVVYDFYLEPYKDSFKAGNTLNIKDIGAGEDKYFDTAGYKLDGKKVHAKSGISYPNNNYLAHIWTYAYDVKGSIWNYYVCIAKDTRYSLFDSENYLWKRNTPFYNQGFMSYGKMPEITTNHDMYSSLKVKTHEMKNTNADKLVIGNSLSFKPTTDYESVCYDLTRQVVCTVDGRELDRDLYKVEFREAPEGETSLDDNVKGAGAWMEMDQAPNKRVNQCRVTFKKDAFRIDENSEDVYLHIPMKAKDNYNSAKDSSKLVHSVGALAINKESTETGIKDSKYSYLSLSQVLAFPKKPEVVANIEGSLEKPELTKKGDKNTGTYTVRFETRDEVDRLPSSFSYNMLRVLTFDKVYDIDTFKLEKGSKFKVVKIEGNKVYLETGIIPVYNNRIENVKFSIETKYNLRNEELTRLAGTVKEEFSLQYLKPYSTSNGFKTSEEGLLTDVIKETDLSFDDFVSKTDEHVIRDEKGDYGTDNNSEINFTKYTVTSTDSAVYYFDSMNSVSSMIESVDRKLEPGDEFVYNINVMTGEDGFTQDIYMPYNGDSKDYISMINKVNKTNIDIDDETGLDENHIYEGIGRSKFNGKYIISEITLDEYSKDTKVILYNGQSETKLDVKDDGKVDVSKLTDMYISNQAVKIRIASKGKISENQGSGVKATIKLKPSNNDIGNDYVMWLGQTKDCNNVKNLSDKITWPDTSKVVASSISGYVWSDGNENSIKDEEDGFGDVSVLLQKYDEDKGEYIDIRSMKTQSDGFYKFDKLRSSDKYRVVLKNIKRDVGKDTTISSINGSTSETSKDGTLVIGKTNRFGVFEKTTQTFSYPSGYGKYTDSKAPVKLGKGVDVSGVNFGFKTHDKDLALDKSSAKVTNKGGFSEVEWDVTVKNNSSDVISGLKLSDRMSDKVSGVESSIGYMGVKKEIIGDVVAATGSYPLGPLFGSLIATTEGAWLVNFDGNIIKVQDIEGKPVAVTGAKPLSPKEGSLIATTKGAWLVKSDGSTIKVQDIQGTPVTVIGDFPLKRRRESLVVTTEGVWLVNFDGSTIKVKDIEGSLITVKGRMKNDGFLIATTEGAWVVRGNGITMKIQDIEGKPELMTGDSPYSYNDGALITTTEGIWLIRGNRNVIESIKVQGIRGTPIAVTGRAPCNSEYGSLVATTEGAWLVRSDGNIIKVQNIQGVPVAVIGQYPLESDWGSAIVTTKGVWLINSNESTIKVQNVEDELVAIIGDIPLASGLAIATTEGVYFIKPDGNIMKVQGAEGEPVAITGGWPLGETSGTLLATTEGAWIVNSDGTTTTDLPIGATKEYIQDQSISASSVTKEGAFVRRTYELPDIHPGEKVTLRIKGMVPREATDFVVGNQAWVTSDLTPRSGITTSKVTGSGMEPGVPDIPVLPSVNAMRKDGIYGSATVGINKDIDHDSTIEDDLADQTPALIKAIPEEDVMPSEGSLSGIAWFDKNKNGVRESSEARLENVKVTARNVENPEIFYQTTTDSKGSWKIENMILGNYEVHYDVSSYTKDGKHFKATTYGGKTSTDSDIDESGFVKNLAKVEDGKAVSGVADAGLVELDGKIKITKAAKYGKDGKDDEDIIYGTELLKDSIKLVEPESNIMDIKTGRVDDGDNSDLTQGYGFKVENLGSEELTNITLSDKTLKGEKALISPNLTYYEGDKLTSRVTLENGIVTKDGKPLVMKQGSKLLGTLDVGFTKKNPLHQDEFSVSAAIVSGDSVLGSVKDSDGLTTKYVERPARMLTINKYGVRSVDSDNKEALESVTFRIEKVQNPYADAKDYKFKSLGKFATDENGRLDVRLDAGKYKLVEEKAALGYLKPDESGWLIDVSYDEAGKPLVKVSADSKMPYAETRNGDSDKYWGEVDVYNYKLISIPETGGNTLVLLFIGGALVIAGVFVKKRKLS